MTMTIYVQHIDVTEGGLVIVRGHVSATNITVGLHPRYYVQAPPDGIWEFELSETVTGRPGGRVLVPFTATAEFPSAEKARGVRVFLPRGDAISLLKVVRVDAFTTKTDNHPMIRAATYDERTGQLVTIVGDVGDKFHMHDLIMEHQVNVIFHAAAYKHVPVMEANVHAAVRNNVFALLQLLDTAEASGCEAFILISSDKAVNPTSVMGATKRIGELILASRPSSMRCVAVRFGNVLGSNGSLIPILQEKLRNNDPLPITHPEIRRFFMTTAEAVSLVLQAFVIGKHRDILVLDMGESLKVLDIAKTLIALSGKSENEVQIVFTGLRDGEKFYEELFYESERVLPSEFDKIKRTHGKIADWKVLQQALRRLQEGFQGDDQDLRAAIKGIVPEYCWTADNSTGFPAGQKARTAVNSGD